MSFKKWKTFDPSFFLRTYRTKDKQIQLKRLFFFLPISISSVLVLFLITFRFNPSLPVETRQKAQRECLGNLHLEWSIQRSRDIFEARNNNNYPSSLKRLVVRL